MELSPLEELPLECWIRIALQSADRQGLLSVVPLVSQRLRETLFDPWLRSSLLRELHSSAVKPALWEEGDDGVVAVTAGDGTMSLSFPAELASRTELSRWHQMQLALMKSAIVRRSLRTCQQCLDDGLDPTRRDADGVTPIYLAMKHNFPEVLPLLLGVTPSSRLPSPSASSDKLAFTQAGGDWAPAAFVGIYPGTYYVALMIQ